MRMVNINWQQYTPHMHILLWVYVGSIVTWKITPFLRAMREACSEKSEGDVRGKVSFKRIIPFIFTLLICYMVIGHMHGGKVAGNEFNITAFWGLLFFISLATTVITVTQANSFLDKINILKGKITDTKITQEGEGSKVEKRIQTVEGSVAPDAKQK